MKQPAMTFHVQMQEPYRAEMCYRLNVLLSSYIVHAQRVRIFYWNHHTEHLRMLRPFFFECIRTIDDGTTKIAGRILSLGGIAGAPLKIILERSILKETARQEPPRVMVEEIETDDKKLSQYVYELCGAAKEEGDMETLRLLEEEIALLKQYSSTIHGWLA